MTRSESRDSHGAVRQGPGCHRAGSRHGGRPGRSSGNDRSAPPEPARDAAAWRPNAQSLRTRTFNAPRLDLREFRGIAFPGKMAACHKQDSFPTEWWQYSVATPFIVDWTYAAGWALAFGMILAGTAWLTAAVVYPHSPSDSGCCERCGYNLTGNVSGRCPECGRQLRSEKGIGKRGIGKRVKSH
jgi:hypothetical protein